MKRILEKILWGVGIIGAVCVIAFGVAWLYWKWEYKDRLVKRLLEDVVRSRVEFETCEVDFWTHYPLTEVHLTRVLLFSTDAKRPGVVLGSNEVRLRLDLRTFRNLKTERYIQHLAFDSTRIYFHVDSQFVKNYQFFRPYDPDSANLRPTVRIERLAFRRLVLRTVRQLPDRDYLFEIDSLICFLQVHRHDLEIKLKARGTSRYMDLGKYKIMVGQLAGLDADFTYSKANKCANFRNAIVQLERTQIEVKGDMRGGQDPYYDLTFESDSADIHTLYNLVPDIGKVQLSRFDASGRIAFRATIVGADLKPSNPHVELSFACRNAAFKNRITGGAITGLNLKGIFSNGLENHARTTRIELSSVVGRLADRPFEGRLVLGNLVQPEVDLAFRSQMALTAIADLLNLELPSGSVGEVKLDILANGKIRNLAQPDSLTRIKFSGDFEIIDTRLPGLRAGWSVDSLNAAFRLDSQTIAISRLSGKLNGQRVEATGRMDEVVPYLLGLYPSLKGQFTLFCPQLVLDSVLVGFPRKRMAKQPFLPKSIPFIQLPKNLFLAATLGTGPLFYQQIRQDTSQVIARMNENGIELTRLYTEGPLGRLELNGKWLQPYPTRQELSLNGALGLSNLEGLLAQARDKTVADSILGWQLSTRWKADAELRRSEADTNLRLTFDMLEASALSPNKKVQIDSLRFRVAMDERVVYAPSEVPIVVDSVYARVNSYPVWARLSLASWRSQHLTTQLSTRVDVADLLKLVNRPIPLDDVRGDLEFSTTLRGLIPQFQYFDTLIALNDNGRISLSRGGFTLTGSRLPFTNLSLLAHYDANGTQIQRLSGKMGRSDFNITGLARDILPFVFQKGRPLQAELNYEGDTFDLRQLLLKQANKPESGLLFDFPRANNVNATFRVGNMLYDGLTVRQLRGKVGLHDAEFCADSLNFDFGQGHIAAEGRLNAKNRNELSLNAFLSVDSLQIERVLTAVGLLGRDVRQQFNAMGRLTGRFGLEFLADSTLKPNLAKSYGSGDGYIQNGILFNFRPAQKLQKIFPKQKLDTLNYELVFQQAHFQEKVISLPYFSLNTPPLQVLGTGSYSLEGSYDFRTALWIRKRKLRLREPDVLATLDLKRLKHTLLVLRIQNRKGKTAIRYDGATALRRLSGKVDLKPISPIVLRKRPR